MLNSIRNTLVLIFALGVPSLLFAQSSERVILSGLIVESSTQVPQGTPLKKDVTKQSSVHINFEVAVDGLINGDLVELSLFDENYLLSIDKTYPGSQGVVTYSGSLYNQDEEKVTGNVLLTSGGGAYYGLITTATNIYQLVPSNADKSSLYYLQQMKQIPAEGITDFGDSVLTDQEQLEQQESKAIGEDNRAMMSGGATVDVLVLYTPSARADNGGTTATVNWINTMFADYNNILSEVGLSTYSFNVKAALETKWPTFPTTYHENSTHNGTNACEEPSIPITCDSIVADQYWVSTNATVASLRNQYAADLVVLITADNQKHLLDDVHGFAGWKGNPYTATHGARCNLPGQGPARYCGEFVSVRDIYALSNKTLHHEVGHAMGMQHPDGTRTFGWYNDSSEQMSNGAHLKPFTVMEARIEDNESICLWSSNTSSSSCVVRLPFFADDGQYRTLYYGWPTPRKFSPNHHVEPEITDGMDWISIRK